MRERVESERFLRDFLAFLVGAGFGAARTLLSSSSFICLAVFGAFACAARRALFFAATRDSARCATGCDFAGSLAISATAFLVGAGLATGSAIAGFGAKCVTCLLRAMSICRVPLLVRVVVLVCARGFSVIAGLRVTRRLSVLECCSVAA